VSPEKQTRFLSSANERAPFHASPHATLPGESSAETTSARAPLLVHAHYDAVILSEEAALFPLVRVSADEPPRSRRIPLQRCNLFASTVRRVTSALWTCSQIQPFEQIARPNSSGINTSEKFPIPRISLIPGDFNPTRINTSGNKDLKSIRINTSGSNDLKSFRINTYKKHGRGVVFLKKTSPTKKSALPLFVSSADLDAELNSPHFLRGTQPFINWPQYRFQRMPTSAPRMTLSARGSQMASRILIADDHEMVRRGIRSLLEARHRDVQVLEAGDGREAVEKTIDFKPDLVILDLSMPQLDGFSAAREIRKVTATTPILILTFEKTGVLTEMAQSIGVSGYITKSEDSDTLLHAIDAAMGIETTLDFKGDDPSGSPTAVARQNQPAPLKEDPPRSPAETVKRPVLRVLLLHHDASSRKRCLEELKRARLHIEADVAVTFEQCTEKLDSKHYDIVVAEYPIPESESAPAGNILPGFGRHVPLILLTHQLKRTATADLITRGAADCVEIDDLGQLPIAIRRALKENTLHGERDRVEQKLQHTEAHYRALMGNLAFGICHCGMDGQFVDVNRALLTMLGYSSKQELLRLNFAAEILNDPLKRARLLGEVDESGRVDPLEIIWTRKNGTLLKVRLSGREVDGADGNRNGYEIIVQDVTKQRELEDNLRQQATTDPLTGLANYRSLVGVLNSEIRRFNRTGREFAVLLFDLDGLKQINDRHGHLTGSEALCRLADVLAAGCRSIDTAARFGGDEFVVVLPETGLEAAKSVAQRLCDNLANDRGGPRLSVSAGVAIYDSDGDAIETLLFAADKALYRSKSKSQSIPEHPHD